LKMLIEFQNLGSKLIYRFDPRSWN